MTDLEEFEAHIKSAAWYQVLSESAKEDDEGASVLRMAKMAASEAWQASRRGALEKAATAAERAGGYPVGANDGCGTRTIGTSLDAAQAIRAMSQQEDG